MNLSQDLFDLVHSLSKGEKRLMRLNFSVEKGSRNYIKLLDYVSGMTCYDPDAVKRHFSGDNAIRQLPAVKNYLYRLILKRLSFHHTSVTCQNQLYSTLIQLNFLYGKGLYKQCRKLLRKATLAAQRNELFALWMALLEFEQKVNRPALKKVMEAEAMVVKRLENLVEHKHLFAQFFELSGKIGRVRSRQDMQRLNAIFRHPMLSDEHRAVTAQARVVFHNTHAIYHYMRRDFEKVYRHLKKRIAAMESLPYMIREEAEEHIAVVTNLCISCRETGRHNEFYELLEKFKNTPYGNRTADYLAAASYYELRLNAYTTTGQFEKAVELIPRIQKEIYQFAGQVHKQAELVFYFLFAVSYFGAEEYKESLYWVNRILNDPDKHFRDDVWISARMLNLLIHYELGNRDLLDYIIRSTYRFLKNRKFLYKFEKEILFFIQKMSVRAPDKKAMLLEFKSLKSKLERIAADPLESMALVNLEYIAWLESKISGIPFAEIIRKKAMHYLVSKPGK